MYVAFMAVNCGDTLASELGMLSPHPPVLITSGRPVAPGQDGGVSLWGTVAAALGGLLIGAWAGGLAPCFQCVLWAVVGSTADSVMGSLYQAPTLKLNWLEWKFRNSVVNTLSSGLVAGLAGLASELPAVYYLMYVVALVAFIVPILGLARMPSAAGERKQAL